MRENPFGYLLAEAAALAPCLRRMRPDMDGLAAADSHPGLAASHDPDATAPPARNVPGHGSVKRPAP